MGIPGTRSHFKCDTRLKSSLFSFLWQDTAKLVLVITSEIRAIYLSHVPCYFGVHELTLGGASFSHNCSNWPDLIGLDGAVI